MQIVHRTHHRSSRSHNNQCSTRPEKSISLNGDLVRLLYSKHSVEHPNDSIRLEGHNFVHGGLPLFCCRTVPSVHLRLLLRFKLSLPLRHRIPIAHIITDRDRGSANSITDGPGNIPAEPWNCWVQSSKRGRVRLLLLSKTRAALS